MFKTILSPFTTATSVGVAVRYLTTIVGAVLSIIGILGYLTPEQIAALNKQVPELLSALGAVAMAAVPLYAMLTKSSSDKAATAAKLIDEKLPPSAPVKIETPAGQPDILVPAKAA